MVPTIPTSADAAQCNMILRGLIKPQLTEEELQGVDDEMISRFYRATGKDRDLTVKRLVVTAKWRLKERPENKICGACKRDPESHWMHPVGHDKLGRPVLFTSFIMVKDAGAAHGTEHMIVEFERAVRLMGPGVESWVWVIDFKGFGRRLGDLNPTLAKNFLELSASHYPERLGQLLVVDAPGVVGSMWDMLEGMVDPVTHAKVRFLPYDLPEGDLPPSQHQTTAAAPLPTQHPKTKVSKLWEHLCAIADPELVSWLVHEMRDVRAWDEGGSQARVKSTYDFQLLQKALSAAGQAEGVVLPRQSDGHCHYGTASLLAKYTAAAGQPMP